MCVLSLWTVTTRFYCFEPIHSSIRYHHMAWLVAELSVCCVKVSMALARHTQLVTLVPAPVPVRMPVDMPLLLEVAMVMVVRRHKVAVLMVDIIPLATNGSLTHASTVDITSKCKI